MNQPLADRVRPHGFDDMVGQENLVGPGGILRRMVDSGHLTNMIFFGPPGTGKTTAALLKDGKAKVKGLYSERTGKTYDGTVLLCDTGEKYVNYRIEQRK